jgi:hypothetical protein
METKLCMMNVYILPIVLLKTIELSIWILCANKIEGLLYHHPLKRNILRRHSPTFSFALFKVLSPYKFG